LFHLSLASASSLSRTSSVSSLSRLKLAVLAALPALKLALALLLLCCSLSAAAFFRTVPHISQMVSLWPFSKVHAGHFSTFSSATMSGFRPPHALQR